MKMLENITLVISKRLNISCYFFICSDMILYAYVYIVLYVWFERIVNKIMDFSIGQIIKMKKKHPCGSDEWKIIRIGADFRLMCTGCEHQIMLPRVKVEKNIKNN